jgi:hypothetical protein
VPLSLDRNRYTLTERKELGQRPYLQCNKISEVLIFFCKELPGFLFNICRNASTEKIFNSSISKSSYEQPSIA